MNPCLIPVWLINLTNPQSPFLYLIGLRVPMINDYSCRSEFRNELLIKIYIIAPVHEFDGNSWIRFTLPTALEVRMFLLKVENVCIFDLMDKHIFVRQDGYREGIIDGKESTSQKGFDCGYKSAFKSSQQQSEFKGFLTSIMLRPEFESGDKIKSIIDKLS